MHRNDDIRAGPGAAAREHAAEDGARAERATPGSLYVVATPLGHLRDVTLRALDILRSVDLIAAEDTRVTGTLLRRYGIATRLLSLNAHNETRRAPAIIGELAAGKSVALLTDAGTPGISDPGARLVRAVRETGLRIVPLPGPSAASAAISVAGLDAQHFVFIGFLPPKPKARRTLIETYGQFPAALVIYEAPHRVRATVAELAKLLPGDRTLIIARELTKVFETVQAVRLADAERWIAADPDRERGEFVLIVDAAEETAPVAHDAIERERWLAELIKELPPARAARVVAAVTGAPRDEVYALAQRLKTGGRSRSEKSEIAPDG